MISLRIGLVRERVLFGAPQGVLQESDLLLAALRRPGLRGRARRAFA
jgi:hypothetical protein